MRVITALVIFCLFAVGQAASVQTRTISGTVVDPADQPIPGVAVELRKGTSVLRKTVSDKAGAWKFEGVDAGDFVVRFALAGFVTTDLHLKVGDTSPAPARVVLKVGAVSETVSVIASGSDTESLQTRAMEQAAKSSPASAAPPPPPPAPAITEGYTGSLGAAAKRSAAGGHVAGHIYPPPSYDSASYAEINENRFRLVKDHPLSTFSIDVDTASYSNVRRFLNEGRLPPADAVRIEELINYFRFDYPNPSNGAPVSVTTELGAAPWNPKHRLALVGLRSTPIRQEKTPPRNLTFLLDVSGSMAPQNRLPLVKTAMRMLVDTLRPEDKVAIVVYAGASGLCLPATSGEDKQQIQAALERLSAGGSTNGASGIQLAYNIASENFVRGGINRVILATDGDFNVGVTSQSELTRLIEEKRERGIFLSVLGVGDNNLKDSTMEALADKGNGNYSYLDSIQEARRVLIKEAGATLVTVAKDVKLQIEFNPVQGRRLSPDRLREPHPSQGRFQQRQEGRRRNGRRSHGDGAVRAGARGRARSLRRCGSAEIPASGRDARVPADTIERADERQGAIQGAGRRDEQAPRVPGSRRVSEDVRKPGLRICRRRVRDAAPPLGIQGPGNVGTGRLARQATSRRGR